MSACRVWILVCALGLAVGLSACGQESDPPSGENDGVYVNAGPITYQLQVSRALNQYTVEDRQYLAGLPAGEAALTPNQLWYGVFLWAKNQTSEPHETADTFKIVDTEGNPYYPIRAGHRDQRVRVDVADPAIHRISNRLRARPRASVRRRAGWSCSSCRPRCTRTGR